MVWNDSYTISNISSCCFVVQVTTVSEEGSISGSLHRSKKSKRNWKRLWFLLKDKVLYTYRAQEVRGNMHSPLTWTAHIYSLILYNEVSSAGVLAVAISWPNITKSAEIPTGTLLSHNILLSPWQMFCLQEKVASESLPLLGFTVRLPEKQQGEEEANVFQLFHKHTLYYTFKAEDNYTAQRWEARLPDRSF